MSHDTEVGDSDPLIGEVLEERYRVLKKLGQGGMGAVYAGEHLLTKRRVAIKVLTGAQGPEVIARFQREAQAATAIGHPNIVEVLDMGRLPAARGDRGSFYMVLELLEGRDLWDTIEAEGLLPIGRTARIVVQLCEALHAAHEKGIVHRDVKPENVFLVPRGQDADFVKVLDFGISKVGVGEADGGRSMTHTGSILGTPYYLSAEQAHGRKDIDRRTDVYAVGVVLYRALCGVFPFDAESFPMLIVKICTEPPVLPRTLRPDIPEALEAVILRCLEKTPERRFATTAEVAAALRPFRDVVSVAHPRTDPLAHTAAAVTRPVPEPQIATTRASEPIDASRLEREPSLSRPSSTQRASTPMAAQSVAPSQLPPPPTRSPWPMVLGIAALITLAIAGTMAMRSGADDPHAASAPPSSEPPALIRVRITTSPARATLTLDGTEVPNPYDAEQPSSREPHTIAAAAPGYRSVTRIVAFTETRDVLLELSIDPEASAPVVEAPVAPDPPAPSDPPRTGARAVRGDHPHEDPPAPGIEVAHVTEPDRDPDPPAEPPPEDEPEGASHALKTIRIPR